MFDFSFGELAVIGAVALVVLGPERLPKVARTAGGELLIDGLAMEMLGIEGGDRVLAVAR